MTICAGAVGDIDGIGQIAEAGSAFDQRAGIGGVGRGDFNGDDEAPGLAGLLKSKGLPRRGSVRANKDRLRMGVVDHPQPGRVIPKPVVDRL